MAKPSTTAAEAADAESKYTYFVLAASGAALGFTLEKHTAAQGLNPQYAFLLAATFAWLLSFLFGLRAAQHQLTSLNLVANAEQLEQALQVARRNIRPPEIHTFEEQFAASVRGTNSALEKQGKRLASYLSCQYRLLMAGAVAYTAFHLFPLVAAQ